MSRYQDILRRTISEAQFEQLCRLWQQTAQLTQAVFVQERFDRSASRPQEYFRLLICQQFSALLVGNKIAEDAVHVSVTFDPQVIANSLPLLEQQLDASVGKYLQHIQQTRLSEQTDEINRFARQLLEILASSEQSSLVHKMLCHQPEKKRFYQISFQTSQDLDWLIILKKTVEQVRSLLQVDRLVIYRTDVELVQGVDEHHLVDTVTHEALASESVPSILHFHEEVCFSDSPECREKYRRGFTLAVDDVSTNPHLSVCLKMLMQDLQVKAKIVTPINVQGKLWGLLIAHQCFTTRQWQQDEIQFLKNVADYLAITVYQAQTYQQLQQQKQGLEKQVAQRVQELEEARIVAQAANHSKSEFLSNISHEFRTPLTHVIGLSGTLMHWSKQGVSFPANKQQQYLETIHNSGKQLLDLINNLLDLSQVKAGQSLLHISEFSLQQLSRRVLQSVEQEAVAQNITLQLDLQVAPYQDRFWADPERVQQILWHLLDNAIKFTPAGKTVTLRVCRDNEHAIFQVEDNGIGVAQEQLPLLFETFQQLEQSRQRTHGGAGLGLTLTKELVDLHQGSVEVESTVGKGSLFTVRLPLQSCAVSVQPQRSAYREQDSKLCSACLDDAVSVTATPAQFPPVSTSGSKEIVVLIENNQEHATLLGKILSAAGYQMVWLTDGSTAAAQIQWLQPNYVILSRQLPNLGQTVQSLKQLTSNDSKFLLISSEERVQQELSEQLIDDIIQMPLSEQILEKLSGKQ